MNDGRWKRDKEKIMSEIERASARGVMDIVTGEILCDGERQLRYFLSQCRRAANRSKK
jgi:hypothetical protein